MFFNPLSKNLCIFIILHPIHYVGNHGNELEELRAGLIYRDQPFELYQHVPQLILQCLVHSGITLYDHVQIQTPAIAIFLLGKPGYCDGRIDQLVFLRRDTEAYCYTPDAIVFVPEDPAVGGLGKPFRLRLFFSAFCISS